MSQELSKRLLRGLAELPPRPAKTVAENLQSLQRSGIAAAASGLVSLKQQFAFQSYFSSTLIEQAILAQNVAEPIVPSTKKIEPTPGYGVALYPSSETPVAVKMLLGGKSSSSIIILKPGDLYVSKETRFDGIQYGLPSGWLGGGAVQLRILQNPDDEMSLAPGPELIFHRIRLPVWAITANPAATDRGASPNWPRRFPWPNSFDLNGNPQQGKPYLGVTPTKTLFRLRKSAMAGAARMRFLLLKSDDLDLGSDNATLDAVNTSGSWVDLQFPAIAASGFQIGGVATAEFPTLLATQDLTCRPGGDADIAILLDMDGTIGATTVLGTTVMCDIVRYGTL